jgi:aminopeptidase N
MVPDKSTRKVEDSPGVLLELHEEQQTFRFDNVGEKPVLSFLRSFTAPVSVETFHNRNELGFLMARDSDPFNRWDAAYRLSSAIILEMADTFGSSKRAALPGFFIEAVRQNLAPPIADPALTARAISLPAEGYLKQEMDLIDPENLHRAHMFVKTELARMLGADFMEIYQVGNQRGPHRITVLEMGRRSLRNCCLDYLASLAETGGEITALCQKQYYEAMNMTDRLGALSALVHLDIPERDELLEDFEHAYLDDTLLMDKWFALQACSAAPDTFERVMGLLQHGSFTLKNPNKVRSLIGTFSHNHYHFHNSDGSGYMLLSDMIIRLDDDNPQLAARLATPLISWKRYDTGRQALILRELEKIRDKKQISRDVFEVVNRSLAGQ